MRYLFFALFYGKKRADFDRVYLVCKDAIKQMRGYVSKVDLRYALEGMRKAARECDEEEMSHFLKLIRSMQNATLRRQGIHQAQNPSLVRR